MNEHDLKEKILMSAIEEFGRKGYETASTNEIVKNAGASKGLLFHYYNSKKELFVECLNYVFDKIALYIIENTDFSDDDIFSRIQKAIILKLKFYKEHPSLMGMTIKLWFSENNPEIENLLKNQIYKYNTYMQKFLFENLNIDKFRKDINYENIVEYISLLIGACWIRFSKKYNDNVNQLVLNLDSFIDETAIVLDIIKNGTYIY